MNYDALLTETEFANFTPNSEVLRYLELTRHRLGLSKRKINVLDWGSGRGEYVLWLREAGYNAFGVEIRREAAERGKNLIRARGHDYDCVIRLMRPNCQTDLPGGFFHFVFTHYVLEHVADIDSVAGEIARLTVPGGYGFHVYPGKLRPIEPHLFMPFIHWLPKTSARKWAIRSYIACGIEPKWEWLAQAGPQGKTQAYYEFCVNETFYRSFRRVRDSFNRCGLKVVPVVAEHPALRALNVMPSGIRKLLVEVPVMLFQTVEFLVRKPHTAYPPI